MIIKDISVYPVCYNIIRRLKSFSMIHKDRDSWVIKITDENGYIGYGEASPLPNFNEETFEVSGYALEGFKLAIEGIDDDIDLDEIMILIKAHTLNVPSANFAIETAVSDILSQQENLPLNKYLNSEALSKVLVNGVYELTNLKNYNVIKIKCGFRNLYDEIDLLNNLSEKCGSSVSFIIDLNQAYDLSQSIRFFKEMEQFNIKYIEQPINKANVNDLLELRFHSNIPIALDESIHSIESINDALAINYGDVFIIKPQSIGSFSDIKKAINLVKSAKKKVVLTSSLEGVIGRLCSMHLSSSNIINEACGLVLEPIYNEENNILPTIDRGSVNIPNTSGLGYRKN